MGKVWGGASATPSPTGWWKAISVYVKVLVCSVQDRSSLSRTGMLSHGHSGPSSQ